MDVRIAHQGEVLVQTPLVRDGVVGVTVDNLDAMQPPVAQELALLGIPDGLAVGLFPARMRPEQEAALLGRIAGGDPVVFLVEGGDVCQEQGDQVAGRFAARDFRAADRDEAQRFRAGAGDFPRPLVRPAGPLCAACIRYGP
jgi:hypothetical protein